MTGKASNCPAVTRKGRTRASDEKPRVDFVSYGRSSLELLKEQWTCLGKRGYSIDNE